MHSYPQSQIHYRLFLVKTLQLNLFNISTPVSYTHLDVYKRQGSYSAGIAYKGKYRTFVLGFPFESIQGVKERARVMSAILGFFGSK